MNRRMSAVSENEKVSGLFQAKKHQIGIFEVGKNIRKGIGEWRGKGWAKFEGKEQKRKNIRKV